MLTFCYLFLCISVTSYVIAWSIQLRTSRETEVNLLLMFLRIPLSRMRLGGSGLWNSHLEISVGK